MNSAIRISVASLLQNMNMFVCITKSEPSAQLLGHHGKVKFPEVRRSEMFCTDDIKYILKNRRIFLFLSDIPTELTPGMNSLQLELTGTSWVETRGICIPNEWSLQIPTQKLSTQSTLTLLCLVSYTREGFWTLSLGWSPFVSGHHLHTFLKCSYCCNADSLIPMGQTLAL